jgi:hypothetical protein
MLPHSLNTKLKVISTMKVCQIALAFTLATLRPCNLAGMLNKSMLPHSLNMKLKQRHHNIGEEKKYNNVNNIFTHGTLPPQTIQPKK